MRKPRLVSRLGVNDLGTPLVLLLLLLILFPAAAQPQLDLDNPARRNTVSTGPFCDSDPILNGCGIAGPAAGITITGAGAGDITCVAAGNPLGLAVTQDISTCQTSGPSAVAYPLVGNEGSLTLWVGDGGTEDTGCGAGVSVECFVVGADTTPPTITITSPTTANSYPTMIAAADLAGNASDNVGVTQVTWANSRGGNGTANGTNNWSVSGIALQPGSNTLTVTARDAANNQAFDQLNVTYDPPTATTFAFAIDRLQVNEGQAAAVTVLRTGDRSAAQNVTVQRRSAGSNNESDDFSLNGQNNGPAAAFFGAGADSAVVTFIANQDADTQDENVALELTNRPPGSNLGSPGTITIVIADDDFTPPGGEDDRRLSVTASGSVQADRAFFCGRASSSSCYRTGPGADMAERIDASETLEAADLVEIDPENPGRYRKSRTAYSALATGVIASAPSITLGNRGAPGTDHRPLLALMGRVPVKATDEGGRVKAGDLLVSSSTPGAVMRCERLEECAGALVGKALGSIEEATGTVEIILMP